MTKATLVTAPTTAQVLTSTRTSDVGRALAQGLADYLGGLQINSLGRAFAFRSVEAEWAEGIDPAKYPALVVYQADVGQYGTSDDAPATPATLGRATDGQALVCPCVYTAALTVEVWCSLPPERAALMSAVEDMMFPVTWMYGVRLALPYYHGVHARYTLVTGERADDSDRAQQRSRRATFQVEAAAPLVRVVGRLPAADFRTVVELASEG